ncbi:MAG: DUF1648 domain-containing protein [Ruminococcaceae bacterium]|nr:DUF1648 domain-containing protein [Oscillospiraceae bacterium]
MKFLQWKSLTITSLFCLLPILPGVLLWDALPETMAIHFNIYGVPDGFASKGFVVFALPALMVVLQMICCAITDFNVHKHGDRKKFVTVTKWIIPCLCFVLQLLTFGYALGWNVDIRKSVALIVGAIFLVMGNYLPKFDYIKNYDLDTEKARKINRFIGYETVIMGFLFCLSVFFPPISTIVCLLLLLPYAGIAVVYSIITARKK